MVRWYDDWCGQLKGQKRRRRLRRVLIPPCARINLCVPAFLRSCSPASSVRCVRCVRCERCCPRHCAHEEVTPPPLCYSFPSPFSLLCLLLYLSSCYTLASHSRSSFIIHHPLSITLCSNIKLPSIISLLLI